MPTLTQIARKHFRKRKFHRVSRCPALLGHPQKRGVVVKMRTMSPKKPNSAVRRIAKVKLSTGKQINCYVPGHGYGSGSGQHPLRDFSQVLVRGGRVKDLPGIQYHLMRGSLDFTWMERFDRMQKCSKYGIPSKKDRKFQGINTPNPKKEKKKKSKRKKK